VGKRQRGSLAGAGTFVLGEGGNVLLNVKRERLKGPREDGERGLSEIAGTRVRRVLSISWSGSMWIGAPKKEIRGPGPQTARGNGWILFIC